MLEFAPINLSNLSTVREYLLRETGRLCDLTPGVFLMWNDHLKYEYAVEDGCCFIKVRLHGRTAFYPPFGEGDFGAAVSKLVKYCQSNGFHANFLGVSEDKLKPLTDVLGRVMIKEGHDDYVYLAEDLRTLSGKRYHAKKNHVNRFEREHPGYAFTEISAEDVPALLAFTDKFQIERNKEGEMFADELLLVKNLLALFPFCPFLLGGKITTDEGIVAFAVGEKIGDTLFVHAEKALTDVSGAYAVINRDFVRRFGTDVTYVNREDDADDAGLRKSKLSYFPVFMVKKYVVGKIDSAV